MLGLAGPGHRCLAPFALALLCAATLSLMAAEVAGATPALATQIGCQGDGVCSALTSNGFIKTWKSAGTQSGVGPVEFLADLGGKVETAWLEAAQGQNRFSIVYKLTDGRVRGVGRWATWTRGPTDVTELLSPGVGRSLLNVSVADTWSVGILDNLEVKAFGHGHYFNPWTAHFDPTSRSLDDMPAIDFGGRLGAEVASSITNPTEGMSFCARFTDGSVSCVGSGSRGQLGTGNSDRVTAVGVVPAINLGAGRTCQHLAGGNEFYCCVMDGGGVICWGSNQQGQLGTGDKVDRGQTPDSMGENLTEIIFPAPVKKLSLGTRHSCAMYGDDNNIQCWGEGSAGQLLTGTTDDIYDPPRAPIPLPAGRKPVTIAAGHRTTCILFDNGSVKCGGSPAGAPKTVDDTTGWVDLGDDGTRKPQKCLLVPGPVAKMLKARRCTER